MAVTVELIDAGKWRVTATPDSGKAFYSVIVYEKPRAMNPMCQVRRALSKAARIDKAFSLEQIELRAQRKARKALKALKTSTTSE